MGHFFSKKKSKGAHRDHGEGETQPKTLAEVIEATKKLKVKRASEGYQIWDCIAVEASYTDSRVREQNKWADLAYKGDWEELLRMGIELPRLVNSRRLQKQIGPGGAQGRPLAGYTALHQAAWHGAPVEVVQALINLGALRWERTTHGKSERPIDVARSKGHTDSVLLELLEPPNLLPQWSQEDLQAIEGLFHGVMMESIAEYEHFRFPNLEILRELGENTKVSMPVPGMYGGFTFWLEGDHLVSESYCRVMGGSGMTYHITPTESKLVDSGWG